MLKILKYEMILVIIIFVFSFGISIHAEDSKNVILYEEITDFEELYQISQNNDQTKENIQNTEVIISNNNKVDKDSYKVKSYKVKQKLKMEVYDDSTTVTTYSATAIFELIGDGGSVINYDKSIYKSGFDGSLGVRAYSTIYYTETVIDSITYVDLVKVVGGWQVYDYQLYVTNHKINIGQSGYLEYGGFVQQFVSMSDISDPFTYLAPSTWQRVSSVVYYAVGITTF